MEWITTHLHDIGLGCLAVLAITTLHEGMKLFFRALRAKENNHG
jgi:hypothetical protein